MCLFSVLPAQKESDSKITTIQNLFKGGYILNSTISNKLSFQSGILMSDYGGFNQLELPFLLKYGITDKWSMIFGSQLSTITNYNDTLTNQETVGFSQFDISLYMGTEYVFSNTFSGAFSLQQIIFSKSNNNFKPINIDNNSLKFNLGFKF